MNKLSTSLCQNSDYEANGPPKQSSSPRAQTQNENLKEVLCLQSKIITIVNKAQQEINLSNIENPEVLNSSIKQQPAQQENPLESEPQYQPELPSPNENTILTFEPVVVGQPPNTQVQPQNATSNSLQARQAARIESAEFGVFYIQETKIYLTKICTVLFSLVLCPILGVLSLDGLIDYAFFTHSMFLMLFFLGMIDIIWSYSELEELWIKSDDIFIPWEIFTIAFCVMIIYLRLQNAFPVCVFSFSPLALLTIAYLFISTAPRKIRIIKTLRRALFAIQILFITCKIDNYLNWDWNAILCFSWVYFAFLAVSQTSFLVSLYKKLVRPRVQNSSQISKKLGFCWYLGYCSLILLALIALYGVTKALNSTKDFKFLKIVTIISCSFNALLLVFTIITRKELMKFIIFFRLIESHRARFEATIIPKPKKIISLQVEKKDEFFKMISPTYFVQLDKDLSIKGEEGGNKIKSMFNSYKLSKFTPMHSSLKKKYQEISSSNKNTSNNNNSMLEFKGEEGQKLDAIESDEKINFTVNDVEEINKLNLKSQYSSNPEDENLCYICCKNASDAILVPCGHGGVCYKCAAAAIKEKDECMECRKKLEALYRVDSSAKLFDIVKGVEVSKIVVEY